MLPDKKSKTTTNSESETRLYHQRYLRAMNNPERRKILRFLIKATATFEELENKTGMDKSVLEWHLNVLETGFCIEKENQKGKIIFKLTQEGKVVNYMR